MQWLAEVCVRRPVFAAVLSLMVMVLGIAGYFQLGVDRFPKVELPVVTITTVLPGASPEIVESEITDRIEGAVNTAGGIDELRSISTEGVSIVIIQFNLSRDVDVAAQDVRDRINGVLRELPDDIETPVVSKVDPDASPIMYLSVKAENRTLKEMTELADNQIRESFEVLPGVGEVRLVGGQKRTINVNLDPVKLRSMNVLAGEVARAIGTQNMDLPGGRIDTGRDQLTLRVLGRVGAPDEIAQLPVRVVNDRVIRVGDVASVEDGVEETDSVAYLNGEPGVVLSIRKQSGTNTLAVCDEITERVEELRERLPVGYRLEVMRDESGSIRTGTDGVKEHLVVGAFLAALVVLLFLGSVRSTFIAAVAIPTSVLGTFAVMAALGYTLNNITLLALALSVGIVIDDAIVVLENIYRFVEEKGMSPMEAAIEGTREIGLAVLATTLSLIAVFLPVVFLPGIPGRFLSSFGVTMSVAIAVSLFVSFSLTPMLASRWLKAHIPGQHAQKSVLERLVDVFYRPIESAYMVMLRFAMRQRWVVVTASVLSLALLPVLGSVAKKGFLPIDDRAQFEVSVRAPEGMSVASTQVIAERIARQIREIPEVTMTLVTIGNDSQSRDNVASIYVKLEDPTDRERSQEELKDVVRHDVVAKQDASLRISVQDIADIGGAGASTARIQYNLTGPDLKKLEEIATKVVDELRKVPGAVDVDSTLVTGKPELGVVLDRAKMADRGVTVADLATTLRMVIGGQEVSNYSELGEQYEVRLRALPEWRATPEQLSLLSLPSSKGAPVPLMDVVTLKDGTGPSTINRLARQRTITILANAAPGVGENVIVSALQKIVADQKLPPDYSLSPAGQSKLMAELAKSVLVGFALAFIFMYLILAAQFESWIHPFTILLSLPLTLPFALLSIVLFGQALDMFSVLGIFVLFGIVKKNSILQIDHTNHLREQGMPRLEAILQANKDRLRPILMTTIAFVAGMIPLVMSEGIGSGFNRATSGVVVGGQTLSLLLTLLATPVAYSIMDDIFAFLRRWLHRFGLAGASSEPVTPVKGA